jgi:hypothetical protein
MPYKSDTLKINNIKLDRRVKLSPEQKEEIISLYKTGDYTIRGLTRIYEVSRRLIQFILFPDRLKKNVDNYHERGGWEAYYNKNKHAEYMKTHRKYKYKLYKENKLICADDIYCKDNLIILRNIIKEYKLNPFMLHKKFPQVSYNALKNWVYKDSKPIVSKFKPFMEVFKKEYNGGKI